MPRASISLFIKLHSIAGRQQGEQSGTAQQHWQGACGVRGTILCEPERPCQGQGGMGSEEDRAGMLRSKAATDDNSASTCGTELGLPESEGDRSSQQWGDTEGGWLAPG